LQFAQANAQPKNCKRASTSPTQKRISNIFSNASKKLKNATHSRHSMTRQLNNDNGLQGQTKEGQLITARVSWWPQAKP
jgi:hypothetical protein